ncbi:hypothetical protein LTS12_022638 [Elasticomyces elasticus]|nr:hypothetical protein LTS12_022638 [Elasticomyces elasticus]
MAKKTSSPLIGSEPKVTIGPLCNYLERGQGAYETLPHIPQLPRYIRADVHAIYKVESNVGVVHEDSIEGAGESLRPGAMGSHLDFLMDAVIRGYERFRA